MFTVILLNDRTAEYYKPYQFLFQPFIQRDFIQFSRWDDRGTDFDSALPELSRVIKDKKAWNAMVVTTDSLDEEEPLCKPDERNPFDYSSTEDLRFPKESSVPLIRLAHILGGYPDYSSAELEEVYTYDYEEDNGEIYTKTIPVSQIEDEETFFDNISHRVSNIQLLYKEKPKPPEEREAFKELSRKYSLAGSYTGERPNYIELISTRRRSESILQAKYIDALRNSLEQTSSKFWFRNRYPDRCRFLTYDIDGQEHTLFTREIFEFWLTVLSVAINDIPASVLQAYRLYNISVEISRKQFKDTLNEQITQMDQCLDILKRLRKEAEKVSFSQEENWLERQIIPVNIDSISKDELSVNMKVGLSCDKYEDGDQKNWTDESKESRLKLEKYIKLPLRAINHSAIHLKNRIIDFKDFRCRLDIFQQKELQEKREAHERSIFTSEARQQFDVKKLKARLAEADNNVQDEITGRLTALQIVVTSLVFSLIIFLAHTTYYIKAYERSGYALRMSIYLTICIALVTVLGGLVVLIIQRHRLRRKIKETNDIVMQFIKGIDESNQKYGEFFSDICSLMRENAISEGCRQDNISNRNSRSLLDVHEKAVQQILARNYKWLDIYDLTRVPVQTADISFNIEIPPGRNDIYWFESQFDEINLSINSDTTCLKSPYPFVTNLQIEREYIYEDHGENAL